MSAAYPYDLITGGLDGINVWDTIAQNKPSPRDEMVYNIEPFRAALRQG